MNYSHPDRVPYLEEGIREDVLNSWYKQGLNEGKKIRDLYKFDDRLDIDIEFNPLFHMQKFPSKLNDLITLRRKLERLNLKKIWSRYKNELQIDPYNEKIIFLKVHRGFLLSLGIHEWDDLSDRMIQLVEQPDFVHEAMILQFEHISKYVELILKDINVDAVIFNEPIGGNEGPLISPKMFEEFALKKYSLLLNVIRNNNVNIIILRAYANVKILIPSLLKYGFNCLWACETENNSMDYRGIRNKYGRDLRLIGGIDLDALRYGKQEIKKELIEKVPQLIKSGGYIPLADGRIREDISFENYSYYRSLLEKITQ